MAKDLSNNNDEIKLNSINKNKKLNNGKDSITTKDNYDNNIQQQTDEQIQCQRECQDLEVSFF